MRGERRASVIGFSLGGFSVSSFGVIRRFYPAESALNGMKVLHSRLCHEGQADRSEPYASRICTLEGPE